MNPKLQQLKPYPFEKLRRLKAQAEPPAHLSHIALSVGEPQHPVPELARRTLSDHLDLLGKYPSTQGLKELRQAIVDWLARRFAIPNERLDAERHALPVNGTREALFAIAQTLIDPHSQNQAPLVMMPNPFYQIYEGAAVLAGAEPHFLACHAEQGFLPDFSQVNAAQWQRCQLLYICTPGNPSGAVMPLEQLCQLIKLADEYDFVIASDECYSEIYPAGQAPVGLLEACAHLKRWDFARCLVFHSLSKRSNLPGLRSGFVAGDAQLLEKFLLYRTYHGCSMPIQHQLTSLAAWQDEQHVEENRRAYQAKFAAVLDILRPVLNVQASEAGFYLWPETPINEEQFALELYRQQNLTVLPGSYLGREVAGHNPGSQRVRIALVAEVDQCVEAAQRIRNFVTSL